MFVFTPFFLIIFLPYMTHLNFSTFSFIQLSHVIFLFSLVSLFFYYLSITTNLFSIAHLLYTFHPFVYSSFPSSFLSILIPLFARFFFSHSFPVIRSQTLRVTQSLIMRETFSESMNYSLAISSNFKEINTFSPQSYSALAR